MRNHADAALAGDIQAKTQNRKRASDRIVSVIDYRSARTITEIRRLLHRAEEKGNIRPVDWERREGDFRSLLVYGNGECFLHTLSSAAIVKRLRTTDLFGI